MKNPKSSAKNAAPTRAKAKKTAQSIRDLPVSKKSTKDVRGGLISGVDTYDTTLYYEY